MSTLHDARLPYAERLALVQLGWQSECAVQSGAVHLSTSWRLVIGNAIIPSGFDECIEYGRTELRNHLAQIRGDADMTPIVPTAADFSFAPIEIHIVRRTTTGTRKRVVEMLLKSEPNETTDQLLARVRQVIDEPTA